MYDTAVERGSGLRLAAAYAAICVIWGSTYLAIKVGLESFDPLFYAGMRYLLATLIGCGVALAFKVPFKGPLRRFLPAFAVGVLFVAISNGLVFWAETRLDSGFTALLMTSNPLWVGLLTPLYPGEKRVGTLGWVGILVGIVGTVILLAPWQGVGGGLLAALAVQLSIAVWSATALYVRRFKDRYHPFALTVAQMASGGAVLLGLALARGQGVVGPVTWRALAGLAFLVVFGSLVAFGAYFYLLQHWTASKVATSTYINPIVAVLLGSVLLHEPITSRMVLGAAVVLGGVAMVLHGSSRETLAEISQACGEDECHP
jgi:drug/metabolite transporter (DMT)-like permease